MPDQDVSQTIALLSERLQQRLGVSGPTLSAQVEKAGRQLPRRLRKDARYVASVEQMVTHPKLRSLVDDRRLDRSARHLGVYLTGIDPHERRKTARLGVAGSIAFNLLIAAGLLIAFLVWRGFI